MKINELVKNKMIEKGMKAHKLAELAGVDQGGLHRFFKTGKCPSFFMVIKVVKALEIDPAELLKVD